MNLSYSAIARIPSFIVVWDIHGECRVGDVRRVHQMVEATEEQTEK